MTKIHTAAITNQTGPLVPLTSLFNRAHGGLRLQQTPRATAFCPARRSARSDKSPLDAGLRGHSYTTKWSFGQGAVQSEERIGPCSAYQAKILPDPFDPHPTAEAKLATPVTTTWADLWP